MKVLLTALLLTACGSGGGKIHTPSSGQALHDIGLLPAGTVDPELGALVDQFQADAKAHGRKTNYSVLHSIDWGPANDGGGTCVLQAHYGKRYGVVTMDPATRDLPAWQLKELVWHELGHCLLGLQHTETPNEIMNPLVTADAPDDFAPWWEARLTYLFRS